MDQKEIEYRAARRRFKYGYMYNITADEREEVKRHWEDVYKNAIFPETLKEAETRLLWIREAEEELAAT